MKQKATSTTKERRERYIKNSMKSYPLLFMIIAGVDYLKVKEREIKTDVKIKP